MLATYSIEQMNVRDLLNRGGDRLVPIGGILPKVGLAVLQGWSSAVIQGLVKPRVREDTFQHNLTVTFAKCHTLHFAK